AGALLVLFFVVMAAYYHYLSWTGRDGEKTEAELKLGPEPELAGQQSQSDVTVTLETKSLPDDLNEVLGIIRQAGGRLTQKELRSKLRCSEAKVSLMVTDLEDRGLVRKVKQGRGNIVLLNSRE
ncbi:MAG: MarR family transcriptional regulator, partial [ANME-2 cluster archaeon]|nr:MarR family transcriptional regulator [ANME-2 cluster archaeon]